MKRKILLSLMVIFLLWIVLKILWWGQPFPWQVVLIERIDTNQDGNFDRWRLKDRHSGEIIVENDTNFDGRVDQIQWVNLEGKILDLSETSTNQKSQKKVIICFDGVPYEDMAYLWDQGYFREFS